ncbi:FecR domain-containing protein [Verrucomicrobiaceae bacterium 227]
MNPHELIHRYLTGEATGAEVEELDRLLASDPALRQRLITEAGIDSNLREVALERMADPAPTEGKIITSPFRPLTWIAAAAAIALVSIFALSKFSQPPIIATLISGENASWESPLPTTPGSELTAGFLKLTSGIATIEFRSGARVILEAPAHLILETPMKGKLLSGSAMIDVPEAAIGFVMEAPGGYAVDYGTQFSVSVDSAGGSSNFEVLEGEIAVHHPTTGKEVRLTTGKGASTSGEAMVTFEGNDEEPNFTAASDFLRIGTQGHADYVIRNNRRGKHIHPDMLMAKQTNSVNWEMRSFFSFDISRVDLASVESVRLRLNQVPSGRGLATRLPLINTFAIYGITSPEKETWAQPPTWEDAPSTKDGILLGRFDIPRSQASGSVEISSGTLLEFLKNDPDQKVTVVLVRETGLISGEGKGLTHAFANDHHPEASGPHLEFALKASK